jgi:hypothetical protein
MRRICIFVFPHRTTFDFISPDVIFMFFMILMLYFSAPSNRLANLVRAGLIAEKGGGFANEASTAGSCTSYKIQ